MAQPTSTLGNHRPPRAGARDPVRVIGATRQVLTEAEVQAMARANILNALRETRGKVAGAGGAANLLGIPATTLYSRIAKLAIREAEWTVPGG
ncbi:hypothetical protein E4L95_07670 [Paracoccus liaowanqingii]|uniref:DNA binding HTH domain-containing protein n=1 Tax=Paracoccus liaowanqingii TaxID=2560053 RepID=A0A4Z1CI48_9RHOB|nr:helix-turn-helix domain-containing protein [Paracoccus liaowanqingii]TGN62160.1 hypothetical protein E4L95_07670 [Paracoccus liaowanqingii]